MNVSAIKLTCWLAALASAGGLAKYATAWFQTKQDRMYPVETSHVEKVLNSDMTPSLRPSLIVDYKQLQETYLEMNWTGEPPAKVSKPQVTEVDTGPKYEPLDKVLAVFMIRYDNDDPGGSVADVGYRKEHKDASLSVGDTLMAPYDYAVVHAIKPRGLIFAFTDPERPNEEVYPDALKEKLIVKVGADGVMVPNSEPIPTADGDGELSTQTEEVARNTFLLGGEDMDSFSRDYQRILTEDVTTDTYWKDGKRAGVEIKSVKQGSIASRHGAMEGDVLISINGHKVTSESGAISYVKDNSEKYSAWEVVVLRFGKEETVVYHSDN